MFLHLIRGLKKIFYKVLTSVTLLCYNIVMKGGNNMIKNGSFKNGVQEVNYHRYNNVQYHIWNNGEKVDFSDNEGYSFNLVLDFEIVEKLYNEMLSLRK